LGDEPVESPSINSFRDVEIELNNNERMLNVLIEKSVQKLIHRPQTSTSTTLGVGGTCWSKSGGRSYIIGTLPGDSTDYTMPQKNCANLFFVRTLSNFDRL